MKVGEVVYMCLDLAKAASSDDSFLTEEHVVFLLKKFRSFLLKKEYDKEKNSTDVASEFEYQQLCLELEQVDAIDGAPCTGFPYLRTTKPIPKLQEGTVPRVYPIDFYQGIHISYVSRDRMRYVGTNPYLQNIIYTSLGPDLHLYLTSSNPQFLYLCRLRMLGVFEDFDDATGLLCDDNGDDASCDILDADFPIREYLVPTLIELVVNTLTGAAYKPVDGANNAADDLSDLIAWARSNMRSSFQKQLAG